MVIKHRIFDLSDLIDLLDFFFCLKLDQPFTIHFIDVKKGCFYEQEKRKLSQNYKIEITRNFARDWAAFMTTISVMIGNARGHKTAN